MYTSTPIINTSMTIILISIIVSIYIFIIQYCYNKSIAAVTNTREMTFYQTFLFVVVIGTLFHTPLIISL